MVLSTVGSCCGRATVDQHVRLRSTHCLPGSLCHHLIIELVPQLIGGACEAVVVAVADIGAAVDNHAPQLVGRVSTALQRKSQLIVDINVSVVLP